jgi:hypothetical protein
MQIVVSEQMCQEMLAVVSASGSLTATAALLQFAQHKLFAQQALAGRARQAADKFTSVPEPQPETEWETESEGGPEELMVAAEDSAGM